MTSRQGRRSASASPSTNWRRALSTSCGEHARRRPQRRADRGTRGSRPCWRPGKRMLADGRSATLASTSRPCSRSAPRSTAPDREKFPTSIITPPRCGANRDVRRRHRARGSEHPRLPDGKFTSSTSDWRATTHRWRGRHGVPRVALRSTRARRHHHASERAEGRLRDAHVACARGRWILDTSWPRRRAEPPPDFRTRGHQVMAPRRCASTRTAPRRPTCASCHKRRIASASARNSTPSALAHARRHGADRRVGHAAGWPLVHRPENCGTFSAASASRSRGPSPAS